MYLRAHELERYNEFLRSLYAPQSEASLRKAIVHGLIELIPGENVAVSAFDQRALRITSTDHFHRPHARGFFDAIAQFIYDHPLRHTLIAPPILGGSVLSDHATGTKWHRTASYNEAYRPEGLDDQLSIEIHRSSADLAPHGLAIFRRKAGFTQKERALMRMVHPHLRQAFDHVAQGHVPAILKTLESQVLSSQAEGLVLLDSQGRVVYCSEITRLVLAQFFSSGIRRRDRLPIELENLLRRQGTRICTKTMGCETVTIRIYQDSLGRHILAVRTEGPASFRSRIQIRGMSHREAEVLYWMTQGKQNEEIGIILGISYFTVKNHVKRIFSLLNVETRSAALAVALPYL